MSRLHRLQKLFEQASELPSKERVAFVDQACAGDVELHAELSDLLASDEVVKGHTARKAVADLSTLLQHDQPDALVGSQVGRYTLKSCVGAGGMGSVYVAERNDGIVQQTVAIKFLGRDLLGDGFRQRFEVEHDEELEALQDLASSLLALAASQLDAAVTDGTLQEIFP